MQTFALNVLCLTHQIAEALDFAYWEFRSQFYGFIFECKSSRNANFVWICLALGLDPYGYHIEVLHGRNNENTLHKKERLFP